MHSVSYLLNRFICCGFSSLPTDVTETIYSIGAQEDEGWSFLLEKYQFSFSEAEKGKILAALTTSKATDKLSR